ncbi:DUF397 domain-containing protein [Kitasatospora sp. NPDC053057]|uniref:DUF397 domain-containing protein n=1 Tax=Kitasatospora sp. NPDC053057 TaxID=3364062 RepID=UPI0037CB2571
MSSALDTSIAEWEKSSYSNGSGGECVEFSRSFAATGVVPVRDSKDPGGPALIFDVAAWAAFIAKIKSGNFPTT